MVSRSKNSFPRIWFCLLGVAGLIASPVLVFFPKQIGRECLTGECDLSTFSTVELGTFICAFGCACLLIWFSNDKIVQVGWLLVAATVMFFLGARHLLRAFGLEPLVFPAGYHFAEGSILVVLGIITVITVTILLKAAATIYGVLRSERDLASAVTAAAELPSASAGASPAARMTPFAAEPPAAAAAPSASARARASVRAAAPAARGRSRSAGKGPVAGVARRTSSRTKAPRV